MPKKTEKKAKNDIAGWFEIISKMKNSDGPPKTLVPDEYNWKEIFEDILSTISAPGFIGKEQLPERYHKMKLGVEFILEGLKRGQKIILEE